MVVPPVVLCRPANHRLAGRREDHLLSGVIQNCDCFGSNRKEALHDTRTAEVVHL